MSASPSASVTPLSPWAAPGQEATLRAELPSCESAVFCVYKDRIAYTSIRVRALLSTADPISVVFPLNSEDLLARSDFVDHPYPLSWHGIPCALMRVRIGLPVLGSPIPRPFKLLALLPIEDVEDVPPFIRLGAEFLQANRVTVQLSSSPCEGRLVIPYV
jgi:hypothetical protein